MKNFASYPLTIEFDQHDSAAYSPRAVTLVLFAATAYLGVLSAINAHVLRASPALVGLLEAIIYATCFAQIARALTPRLVLSWLVIAATLVLLWLIRQQPDIKGLRDLIIPMLFFALGRHVSDFRFADKLLLQLVLVLVAVGLFEAVAIDTYAAAFQPFSFYVNLGSFDESSAMFEGQTLTLNGYRPEGIGRTLLPWLLGSHRVSSLLMDPVSLGNFAVITVAWALSKTGKYETSRIWLLLGAATLLVLADSRFGTFGVIVMLCARLLPVSFIDRSALVFPAIAASVTVGIAVFMPSYGDSLFGRLTGSGQVFLTMPPAEWLGIQTPLPGYADMGYGYVLTRFGFPLVALMFYGLFLTGALSRRAQYFRAFAVLYASMILAVSGSSLFALKTAAVLWFLMGVASTDRPTQGDGE